MFGHTAYLVLLVKHNATGYSIEFQRTDKELVICLVLANRCHNSSIDVRTVHDASQSYYDTTTKSLQSANNPGSSAV